MDQWIMEAKQDPKSKKVGMYLFHNGIVRETPKSVVRHGSKELELVRSMDFTYDDKGVALAIKETYKLEGIYYVRVWLNSGNLKVGDDIMFVLIGGDIRPNVIKGLQFLVEKIKTLYVTEKENK